MKSVDYVDDRDFRQILIVCVQLNGVIIMPGYG